jgi:adenosylcobinamide kinase / adenosylcobinamide-phosphate guanylyltransferase
MNAGKLTFILGGARSGKSAYAERFAADFGGQVLYIATAEALDDEMEVRIQNHQAARPSHWFTLESPRNVGQAFMAWQEEQSREVVGLVLLDCLTLLTNNLALALPEPLEEVDLTRALNEELDDILAAVEASGLHWLVVSNEVGLGLVPPYPLGRVYRDSLGRANQRLAATADEVLFMVAGIPMKVR